MILQNVVLLCLVLAAHAAVQKRSRYGFGGFGRTSPKKPDDRRSGKIKMPPNIKGDFSTPEQCARICKNNEEPRSCYYDFTLEFYTTMGRACDGCKPNNTNQISTIPQCQCIEADGFERGILSINRMLPGPSIQVCQNDNVIVDVHNNVEGMEAAFHWHGIWQQGSQYYDGVPFVTQCPIPSGTTFRYRFVASNPGTHFYHSHSGLHKIDGQYGSLIVRQPKSLDPHGNLYEIDSPTHVIVLSDWLHEMSIARFPGRIQNTAGQTPVNVLINGKGRWTNTTTNKPTAVQLEEFVVQAGQRYRFRMINSFSTVCPAQLTIEGHSLTLIAQDGETVKPVRVDTIISASGERADFILNANQKVGTYWIRVRAVGPCAASDMYQFAILKYTGGPATPRTPQSVYQNEAKLGIVYNDPNAMCDQPKPNTVCANHLTSVETRPEELLKGKPDHRLILPFRFFSYINTNTSIFKAGSYPRFMVAPDGDHINSLVDGISFAFPRVPPLSQNVDSSDTCEPGNLPKNCGTPCQCPHTRHIRKGAVVEVVLYTEEAQGDLTHPFHLHGYAFRLLKIGQFPKEQTTVSKKILQEVIRRHVNTGSAELYNLHKQAAGKDTVAVPGHGYVILRFKADNPGWWLFHCHFLYHTALGMNVILHVGQPSDLPDRPANFPACHTFIPQ